MQLAPHAIVSGGHERRHCPAPQTSPLAHACPHEPQLAGSNEIDVQLSPHRSVPGPQKAPASVAVLESLACEASEETDASFFAVLVEPSAPGTSGPATSGVPSPEEVEHAITIAAMSVVDAPASPHRRLNTEILMVPHFHAAKRAQKTLVNVGIDVTET
jgi:hypothetical protein